MTLLLDTVTFLWMCLDPDRLSPSAASAIENPANDVFLSAVSAYEITVKFGLGKLPLPSVPATFVTEQREIRDIGSLDLNEEATLAVGKLSALHRDPFDRLLIGQAITHGLAIVTPDAAIAQYPIRVLW